MRGVCRDMVKTICVKCGKQDEVPDDEVDVESLDKMAKLSFKAGILRVVCDDCNVLA